LEAQSVNPESNKALDKPVLNVASFQRLLAAAYLLQVRSDQTLVQPVSAGRTNPCIAEPMVQKQSLSLLLQEPRLQAGKRDVVSGSANTTNHPREPQLPEMIRAVTEIPVANEVAKKGLETGSLAPRIGPMALQRIDILFRRPTSWRAVEALAIAIVFCSMIIVSVHHLSAFPDRMSTSREKPEQRHVSDPTFAAQPSVMKDSRQSANGGEGDLIAQDIVIRYEGRAVDHRGQAANKPRAMQAQPLPEKKVGVKPGLRLTSGWDADMLAASTVIQYGADVTSWSANRTTRTAVDRPGH
jgi:hypothetical protein